MAPVSWDALKIKKRGFKSCVDDVADNACQKGLAVPFSCRQAKRRCPPCVKRRINRPACSLVDVRACGDEPLHHLGVATM